MKRKRGRPKKSGAKKPTVENVDEEAFLDFVAKNVDGTSVPDRPNDYGFSLYDSDSSSASSSSSSSGESDGFHFEGGVGNGFHEPTTEWMVNRPANKRARPKRGEASKKVTSATVKSSKGMRSSSRKELQSKNPAHYSRINQNELKATLEVIKRVMEMDEAVPFNAPVDPVAQGLPDYYSVIDMPMDFGTISSNLQNGIKYLNAEDVYKDVEHIWENCRKYNKKGDYIVYLMKRVKKKFMKYWTASGLRSDILKKPGVDQLFTSMNQPQPSHCQASESNQPWTGIWRPQPSQASVGVSGAGMPHVDASKGGRRHTKRYSEIPSVPGHSVPQQPPGSRIHHPPRSQNTTLKRKKSGRGPTQCHFMFDLPEGERILVPINMLGQPVGAEASKLSSFLGIIARNGKMAPLNFLDWSRIPDANKEDMWQLVQMKFDIDPTGKTWVMKSLASKWRNWKARLKADHYNPHTTDEERLKDCNKRVLPDQWAALVLHWNSEEVQLRCARNKANRAKQKSAHAAGTKSFARIREEELAKRADGKELTRGELYILTRTRKDGRPVDKVAAEAITKLRKLEAQKQKTSHGSDDYDDTYSQVMGKGKGSHMHLVGLGPSAADVWGQKPSPYSLMRMGLEAKRSANEEVSKMLNKMEAMEQKYASLEAQIVRMTSNMENLIDKMGALGSKQFPNNAPKDLLPQAHSSSHAVQTDKVV